MRTSKDLSKKLAAIDGSGYSGYREIEGTYQLDDSGILLAIDHAQVDPFAPPSRVRLFVPAAVAQLPADLLSDRAGRVAVGDFLTRSFEKAARSERDICIAHPGQEILERTSVIADTEGIEVRFTAKLPAAGRRIRGRDAEKLLVRRVPELARNSLLAAALDLEKLRAAVTYLRDREALLSQLAERQLVAFVAEGAILPRAAGDSDAPLERHAGAIAFQAPPEMRAEFSLPSGRKLKGMAIPAGITVIVGGGYHGKSTLLRALERGVYPHIAGDGREWVVTAADAAAIRAEDGRSVANVDISSFINGLPSGKSTQSFVTPNASGSTSQAANVMEALEAGARTLLIDEDTSATNFMIRDALMRELIPAEREPITPLIDRIEQLRDEQGVSTIIVAGGSSAFFAVADQVIAMENYQPRSVTAQARELSSRAKDAAPREILKGEPIFTAALRHRRAPEPRSLHPASKKKPAKANGLSEIRFGHADIDLSALEQLVDPAQTAAIAEALECIAQEADGELTVRELADRVLDWVDADGLDALMPRGRYSGALALPRRHELMAALNRLRILRAN